MSKFTRCQNLHGHKDTEQNVMHGIEIHGAESAHRYKVLPPTGRNFHNFYVKKLQNLFKSN